ncbi:ATP-dependent helicase [Trujillonella endophytica]|uniref:DNA 3'-5' helicase n=1 Tax=Trujillonella endophytica TaxID=673521 RepID=A0A1H8S1T3_9ACTN|nr:ATP-dependent DNA helicase [Trujillella endophytica]SEO72143.1 DNA helicase-2 / ATP-dependent DNA helicase PcrA [Trujillella endophytica]
MSPRRPAAEEQLSFDDLFGVAPEPAPAPRRVLTPAEVAARCGLSYAPSEEQARVVAAPADRPLVVVAGAGSGKTETMAARVAWLIANRVVEPEAILGLTFTRKAASELNERIRLRLGALARHPETEPELRERLAIAMPTVSTYHGYAAALVAEHGLRIGVEPGAGVLGPAMCWGQAATVVTGYTGDMDDVPLGLVSTVEDVLALAGELGEHDVSPAALRAWTAKLEHQVAGYPDAPRKKGPYAPVLEMLTRQRARVALLPLVEAFEARKRAAGAIDYADQVSHAARIAVSAPEVGRRERARWQVVLLDEYQDTSVGQLRMLEALFGRTTGHPVLAVGDPRQSIYGWRGASAGTIERFDRTFPGARGRPAQRLTLATSWRNDESVLAIANAVSALLPPPPQELPDLAPAPTAGRGAVTVGLYETVADENAALAERLAACWHSRDWQAGRSEWGPEGSAQERRSGSAQPGDGTGPRARPEDDEVRRRPTVAVLVRTRKQLAAIAAALRERDLPVEVVGLGGLLEVPEVSDVVATLTVLVDPTAGDALGRLLTGARWRIGPRDLAALEARARALVHARRPAAPDGDGAADGARPEPSTERGSIVEALDDLGDASSYSAAAWRRLRRLGAELDRLRGRLGDALPDLVDEVARTLGLETELASAPGVSPAGARAHLDALHSVAAEFTELAELPSLPAFLGYLRDAEERERGLEPGEVAVNPEAVQLLTGHSAKGLEWDVVAVPGMTDGQFPAKTDSSDSWIKDPGAMPAELRLTDREELPQLRLPVPGSGDQAVVRAALEDYVAEWKEFGLAEEIRIGYVAVTRARHLLLCSGSWWRDGVKPCGPSVLLDTARRACAAGAGVVVHWAEPPAEGATNPALEEWPVGVWPADPLSEPRRRALTAAAELVTGSAAHPLDTGESGAARLGADDDVVDSWIRDADLLLRERARTDRPQVEVPLPSHLSVSALVTLRRDPAELARRLRRPMPAAPAPQARRGTAFHAWLEERFGASRLLDLDELPGSGDELAVPDSSLADLQEAFMAGEWADRQPVEVEVPFETPLGPLTLRGRIDAVFADDDGRFEVIDWKTGPPPAGAELAAAGVQLAAYRLGWARLTGVPVERVSAGFHHVAANLTVRPVDLLDEAGLLAVVSGTAG